MSGVGRVGRSFARGDGPPVKCIGESDELFRQVDLVDPPETIIVADEVEGEMGATA